MRGHERKGGKTYEKHNTRPFAHDDPDQVLRVVNRFQVHLTPAAAAPLGMERVWTFMRLR